VTRKINFREKRNEYLAKYRRQKRRANIFTSVIDIPFSCQDIYLERSVKVVGTKNNDYEYDP
jgi:hypothetical protein